MSAFASYVPPSAIIALAYSWCLGSAICEFARPHLIVRAITLAFMAWLSFILLKGAGLSDHAAAFASSVSLICLGVAETDLRKRLIPDVLVLGLLVLSLSPWSELSLTDRAIGALSLGGMFLVVRQTHFWLRGIEGLGLGDVKLAAAIGALLGVQTGLLAVAASAALLAALMAASREKEPAPFGAGLGAAVIGAVVLRGAFA